MANEPHSGHPSTGRVDWNQYDVPHIWQMLQGENERDAAAMVMAFNNVSQYVDDTRVRLTQIAQRLEAGWAGSEAAETAQAQITEIVARLERDSAAYAAAARELNNIVERIGETKRAVQLIHERWAELDRGRAEAGIISNVIAESALYQEMVEESNVAARDEMRRLDRDLSDARITLPEGYEKAAAGPPTEADMELAGLGPQARAGAYGGYGALPLAEASAPPPPMAPAAPIASQPAARRPMSGVIGATGADRPVTGMMGGAMGAGAHRGGAGGAPGGRADLHWSTRTGVDSVIDSVPTPRQQPAATGGVIDGTPAPDPSTMGVDDSFDHRDRRRGRDD